MHEFLYLLMSSVGLPWWLRWWGTHMQCGRPEFKPCVGKIPWRRTWQSTPVLLPGESPWTEEPGELWSMESQRVEHDWANRHSLLQSGWIVMVDIVYTPSYFCLFIIIKSYAQMLQSCLTLYDSMDYSLRGSSVHGILQARILEWVACPPPGDLPNPGTEPTSLMSPTLAGGFFITSATWEAHKSHIW